SLPRDQRIDGGAPWLRWTARGSSAVITLLLSDDRSVPVNLHAMLLERQAAGRPVTVGLIGAGKVGTMFVSQVRLKGGVPLVAVADLDASRARRQLRTAGWNDEAISAPSLGNALARGMTHVTEDAEALIACPEIEVIVEATGVPAAGIRHALSAIAHGKHIVMVNVE